MTPKLSNHFASRAPSPIRLAQTEFLKRTDHVTAINLAIGNVSLPMHPAMQKRMFSLNSPSSPFKKGTVGYTATAGIEETKQAFLNIIKSSGFETKNLKVHVTDGGSQAMELVVLGLSGQIGKQTKPVLVIDPAYSNYRSMANRVKHPVVNISRTLTPEGLFALPDLQTIEAAIKQYHPNVVIIIPYDNPTGNFYSQETLNQIGALAVKYNFWLLSDEAYRELVYTKDSVSSIWGITESIVPGITGRRISIESASKVWNACGIRIGAIITDNQDFHTSSVAEATANLCPNAIGQYIFGSLAHLNKSQLKQWYTSQRQYYQTIMTRFTKDIKQLLPNIIITKPDAAIYSVIDLKNLVKPGFNASDFVLYCAVKGKVTIDNKHYTLLVAPMSGFYANPGDGLTQMRLAYVETQEALKIAPQIFVTLLDQYQKANKSF